MGEDDGEEKSQVRAWVAWLRAGGTPETTIALRRYYVRRLERDHRDVLALDADTLAAWLGANGWAPNTLKSARAALRSFYGWARHMGLREDSPAHLLPTVRVPRARPRPTPEAAYRAAQMQAGARERLAIDLAGRCGMRRGEIARVRVEDVEGDLAGRSLRVTGKGGHVRLVPLPHDLAETILEHGTGWVFPSPRGGHLTPHHLSKAVSRLLPDGVTMHSLRHRCATRAYAATRDLRAVQELLGHSRPETTATYVLAPDDAVRAAMSAAAA
ncbi:tyrosine-type recombinase/integrase [Knoellia sp. CPCC 206450]|uniref:tyrosine-type recombinase/integrase n=1 Tax=Knoellia tibetensis TaxID=3404798 RepID=UPI003B4394EA